MFLCFFLLRKKKYFFIFPSNISRFQKTLKVNILNFKVEKQCFNLKKKPENQSFAIINFRLRPGKIIFN